MEDKLFEKLEQLDIEDTNLLLSDEIKLRLDMSARKRIEQSVKKKAGYYTENNTIKDKINDIIGGIIMKRKLAFALSGAILLSLGGGGYAYAKTTPVAYVSLDINPSVELGVNTFDQVVSVEAYNEDGQKVLDGTALINSDIDKAIDAVISNAISDGYVKEDGSSGIEITTSSDKENVANELDESLKEIVNETLDNNNVEATVETEKVALQRRDEARQLGITPGKLNLIQKLQALDPTIKVEDYKASSVKDIMKKTKELRKADKHKEENTTDNTQENVTNNTQDSTTVDQDGNAVTQDVNNQESSAKISTSSNADKSVDITEEKDNASSYVKENNSKKEGNESNKKEENENKAASEKKNNGNINSNSKSDSLKSQHSDKGNSENKGKNK